MNFFDQILFVFETKVILQLKLKKILTDYQKFNLTRFLFSIKFSP